MENLFSPIEFTIAAGLLGLVVGSFLNVVIHRLPKILVRRWQAECAQWLNTTSLTEKENSTYNLAVPASHCPQCRHRLGALENIPLVSFLIQRGKCRNCQVAISWRYPITEALASVLAVVMALHFGPTWQGVAAIALSWTLVAASLIDAEHQLLPDVLTLPLLWLGLVLSLGNVFLDSKTAILGVMAGYLSLWSVYWVFRLLTGKEGMGYGDFKLLAALGAWLGWQKLPIVVLLSSLVGAAVGITWVILGKQDRRQPIPFGPFLAAAGWITLLWGEELVRFYGF
ncbi:Leader peptidase / N-methyltransferase [Gammaproteobacteria bacterium]